MATEDTKLAELAAQIVNHLPGRWTITETHSWIVTLRCNDGTALLMKWANQTRRIELSIPIVSHASRRGGTDYCHDDRKTITCSTEREPEAIARDIARRIVPAAIKYQITAAQWLEARTQAISDQEAAEQAMLACPGAQGMYGSTVYGEHWKAHVSSADYVTITLGALTLAQAQAITAVLDQSAA